MEKNHNTVNTRIWEAALWMVVQDRPMVYEQEDVADTLAMRHSLILKTCIPLNPQLDTDKPEIGN